MHTGTADPRAAITVVTDVSGVISTTGFAVVLGVRNLTDEAVLAGFGVGDVDAAHELVRRFERRVYGVAITITRDARLAEDVAQEAFVRAWRHAETFDPRRGSVTSWLSVITRNLAIDTMRAQPRSELVDPDDLDWLSPPTQEPNPADVVVRASDSEWLRGALDDVPDEQRRAVVLAGVVGFTAEEVAEREQIPVGTAKSRIRLAMDKLRRAHVAAEVRR
ncbi:MAG TPA: sigma-70 family RNA polymerase sigma factor [Acidimicrobiia bacterium]|nr:sigma-70 family RNA polymerase sigma factor [Acidimicrobiia bacterium]